MQLIMIEGLPGTGKSTITDWLGRSFNMSTPIFEDDTRIPCNFCGIAGVPISDFQILCVENKDFIQLVKENTLITKNYAYLKMQNYSEDIINLLKRWDMGDEWNKTITVKDYISCALEYFKYWVINIAPELNISIIDSGFLQNPINELLFRKATDDEVIFYIKEIFNIVKDLNPICVYLCRNSADEAINFAKKVKGQGWSDGIDELLNTSGYENFFQHRFDLEKQLLSFIPNIICNVNGDDWSFAKEQIKNCFLL